jgi:hypothetical protein
MKTAAEWAARSVDRCRVEDILVPCQTEPEKHDDGRPDLSSGGHAELSGGGQRDYWCNGGP